VFHRKIMTTPLRKLVFQKEQSDRKIGDDLVCWTRSSVIAVIKNVWVDEGSGAISAAAHMGKELGRSLMPQIVSALGVPVTTYGKGLLLGSDVHESLGVALIHTSIGESVRSAVGGGEAVIPSNVKRGSFGTVIDVPLGHKDDPWEFFFAETLTLGLPDAPERDELMLCLAVGAASPHVSLGSIREAQV
jgi:hypothetical protein